MTTRFVVALTLAAVAVPAQPSSAATFLVRDGQPEAEIIIAQSPARAVPLAAADLQEYVRKMTGATLPIRTAPTDDCPVHVYVGRSAQTDQLGIAADDLDHGAFRIKSGDNWLALLGRDSDFTPPRFFLKSAGDMPEFLKEWDQATGEHWGFANGNLYKEYNGELKIWARDERGSFNAVCEFLRVQGVRWYMPGELGEVVPRKTSLELPVIDATVRPDFALRYPYQIGRMFGHQAATRDEVLWQLRLGWNLAADVIGDFGMGLSHGMNAIYEREDVRRAHPEYYYLANGKRDELIINESRPCLSSAGLFQQNVKYVRSMFDLLDAPLVSVMPQDGYVNLCECYLCAGKGTLERGWDGQISDYVWDYVNRVAQEVYRTHPQKKVNCYAYGAYLLPPTKIEVLSPNIIVGICQNRNLFHEPAEREKFLDLRQAWLAKLPASEGRLVINDYYLNLRPFTMPNLPCFFPRAIADDLRSLRGISIGDFIEVYREPEGMRSLAVDHLNLYVTSRCWWDAGQDFDALLEDYCAGFYGPAGPDVKEFIEYSEANLKDLGKRAEKVDRALALLKQAQVKVAPDTPYGQRLAFLAEYLRPMEDLREQLARGRQDVPEAAAFDRKQAALTLDGQLDDAFWQGNWVYELSDLQTGAPPRSATSFRMGWTGDSICFAIRCEDRDATNLNIATTRNEDASIWNGDCVEILLETQAHSYYQIAFNPAGALIDLDRARGLDSLWKSDAQVATHVGDGFWSAEIRIPVVGEQQADLNPRYGVAGREPIRSFPWYLNVCRQRVRAGQEKEASAWSPTGSTSFHDLKKFGSLHVR